MVHDILNEKKFDLSGDGTYPTARDSMQFTYSCVDFIKNKVVNISAVSKKEADVSSNMLESNIARKCFDIITDKYIKDSCCTFTSDNDNKSFNQVKKEGLIPESRFDENRSLIVSWTVYLVDKVEDKYLRCQMWINTPDHLVGRHENCMHDELPPEHCNWEVGKHCPELFQKMVNL